MAQDELAGYTLLVGYGILLLGAIRVFGPRRVMMVIAAIVFFGLWLAAASLRATTTRRH